VVVIDRDPCCIENVGGMLAALVLCGSPSLARRAGVWLTLAGASGWCVAHPRWRVGLVCRSLLLGEYRATGTLDCSQGSGQGRLTVS
jgi:hypothetical protein